MGVRQLVSFVSSRGGAEFGFQLSCRERMFPDTSWGRGANAKILKIAFFAENLGRIQRFGVGGGITRGMTRPGWAALVRAELLSLTVAGAAEISGGTLAQRSRKAVTLAIWRSAARGRVLTAARPELSHQHAH